MTQGHSVFPSKTTPVLKMHFPLLMEMEEAGRSCDGDLIPGYLEAMKTSRVGARVTSGGHGYPVCGWTKKISTDAMTPALWLRTASVAAAFKGPLIAGRLITA